MAKAVYDAESLTVAIDTEQVDEALGDLKKKTPATVKSAINTTAKKMRKSEIKEAKARYALKDRGRKKLEGFKEKKKASVSSLTNIHRQSDEGHKLDASYYVHRPTEVHSGWDAVRNSPENYAVKVLKSGGYQKLDADAEHNRSKAFLARIYNGPGKESHTAMLRRQLSKKSDKTRTNTGKDRWTDKKSGIVQATWTEARPGGSSMQRKVWDETVHEETAQNLEANVEKAIANTIAKAKAKGAK